MWYHLSYPMFSLLRSSGLLSYSIYRDFLKVQMPALTVKAGQFVTHLFVHYQVQDPFFTYFSHGVSILT